MQKQFAAASNATYTAMLSARSRPPSPSCCLVTTNFSETHRCPRPSRAPIALIARELAAPQGITDDETQTIVALQAIHFSPLTLCTPNSNMNSRAPGLVAR
jgi:hypothetical protein